MSLRQLVDSNKNSEFYKNNYDNIRFELNHLELHHLDGYLYNLYNNGIKDLPNKNNSNIAYLISHHSFPFQNFVPIVVFVKTVLYIV